MAHQPSLAIGLHQDERIVQEHSADGLAEGLAQQKIPVAVDDSNAEASLAVLLKQGS
jgi:hypothetical protein